MHVNTTSRQKNQWRFLCVCLKSKGAVIENGVTEASGSSVTAAPNTSGPSDGTATDNGPADTTSSDGEPVNPAPKRRHRRRTPRSEPGHRDSSHDNKPAAVRKPSRAKSQPPSSTKEKENWRPSSRLDWTDRQMEVRRNDVSSSQWKHWVYFLQLKTETHLWCKKRKLKTLYWCVCLF